MCVYLCGKAFVAPPNGGRGEACVSMYVDKR